MLTRRDQVKHRANMLLAAVNRSFPSVKPVDASFRTLDRSKTPHTHAVALVKHNLMHLPRGTVEAAMLYGEARGVVRSFQVVSEDEIREAEAI